jgi:UDP-N-acetyl-D-mannosaminuronic acid transferase (WecB/TagA/CpsF family)
MHRSLKEVLQHASSPLLLHLHQQLQSQEKSEALWRDVQRLFKDRQDAVAIRQTAIVACQRCVALLNKAPAQESQAYKEFVYAIARRVAEAAKEGGLLGTGGQVLSEAEQALLKELSSVLGISGA